MTDVTVLDGWETSIRSARIQELANGDWTKTFPGRDVLKSFVNAYMTSAMLYDGVVTSLLTAMAADSYEPRGMRAVIDEILAI